VASDCHPRLLSPVCSQEMGTGLKGLSSRAGRAAFVQTPVVVCIVSYASVPRDPLPAPSLGSLVWPWAGRPMLHIGKTSGKAVPKRLRGPRHDPELGPFIQGSLGPCMIS
jgi:hypothetical protein